MPRRIRDALARADDALLAVRDSLTPGQRWTAALLAGVALAVLLAGAPTRTIVRSGEPVAAAETTTARASAPRPGPAATRSGATTEDPAPTVPPPASPVVPSEPVPPTEEPPPPPQDEPAPAPPDDEGDDGGEGGPPPCPDGIPLVVAEAGLCSSS